MCETFGSRIINVCSCLRRFVKFLWKCFTRRPGQLAKGIKTLRYVSDINPSDLQGWITTLQSSARPMKSTPTSLKLVRNWVFGSAQFDLPGTNRIVLQFPVIKQTTEREIKTLRERKMENMPEKEYSVWYYRKSRLQIRGKAATEKDLSPYNLINYQGRTINPNTY